jgi:hypothetical protein
VLERELDSVDHDLAPEVATHHVHSNAHKAKERRRAESTSALRGWPLGHHLDCHYLAPFVEATGRTYPMGHIRSGTLRARAQLRQAEDTVVSAALPLSTPRRFTFGYAHSM